MNGLTGTGSPIEARQSPLPYTVMFLAFVVIGIFFIVWIIFKLIGKYKKSPSYIAKQKQRATAFRDVQALAKKINLSHGESILLFNICRRGKTKNIFYNWTDTETLDATFKAEFMRLQKKGVSGEEIEEFFKLRNHLDRIIALKKAISSSHHIQPGEFLEFSTGSKKLELKIVKNEKANLILEIPEDFEKAPYCPKPLTKIMFTYHSPKKLKYALSTRVVRYQEDFEGKRQMVIQHSNTISMQGRRHYKRAPLDVVCSFSAVNETQGKKGSISYSPKENKYRGKILDISPGGCKLITKLPIKRNQKVWIDVTIPGLERLQCCGLIVGMRQKNDMFELNVAFLDVSTKQRNDIFSYVYNYAQNT
ncbi:MAG: PilZ domain-containing protein [Treponema sp.]|nr:PilZ domain-containing protein [Treponema sp.]